MKLRCYIFLSVTFFVIQIVSPLDLCAQDKLKTFYKEPVADISIFYMDLTSRNIGFSDLAILEKSYRAFSDKSFVHNQMIKSLLYGGPDISDTIAYMDTSYYKKIANCPHISAYRAADPLLIVNGFFCYTVIHGDTNILVSYLNYLLWQSQNAPHSPLGKNTPPDNFNLIQKQRWLCNYTREWIEQYPDEYHILYSRFDSCYTKWKKENMKATYSQFLIQHSRIIKRDYDKGVEILMHASSDGIKSQTHTVVLPAENAMKEKPEDFIREAYENLYQRVPRQEEIVFLQQFISTHKDLTVKQFYYAMMTSDEYKYY